MLTSGCQGRKQKKPLRVRMLQETCKSKKQKVTNDVTEYVLKGPIPSVKN